MNTYWNVIKLAVMKHVKEIGEVLSSEYPRVMVTVVLDSQDQRHLGYTLVSRLLEAGGSQIAYAMEDEESGTASFSFSVVGFSVFGTHDKRWDIELPRGAQLACYWAIKRLLTQYEDPEAWLKAIELQAALVARAASPTKLKRSADTARRAYRQKRRYDLDFYDGVLKQA